jgi:hypothetical protein
MSRRAEWDDERPPEALPQSTSTTDGGKELGEALVEAGAALARVAMLLAGATDDELRAYGPRLDRLKTWLTTLPASLPAPREPVGFRPPRRRR